MAPLRLCQPVLTLGHVEPEKPEPRDWTRMEQLTLAGLVLTALGVIVYAWKG